MKQKMTARHRFLIKELVLKSRDLLTVHNLIVSNYVISKLPSGKFRHQFTPATTDTVYEFEASSVPLLREGERYNIGYRVDSMHRYIVETSAISPSSEVNPTLSLAAAQNFSRGIFNAERLKNDQRVSHRARDGYYWGKKYAWRVFGLVISQSAFHSYLEEIGHPSVRCVTTDPDSAFGGSESVAYLEDGLQQAVEKLIETAEHSSKSYFKSPLYSKRFAIRGLNAITDKK